MLFFAKMLYLLSIGSELFSPYFEIFLFDKPEIVAKANIPKSAIPRNKPAPWLTPAPTATRIEALIRRLINQAGENIFHRVPPMPMA